MGKKWQNCLTLRWIISVGEDSGLNNGEYGNTEVDIQRVE